jgi:putative tryptophan/tyrosine transport system substrate-binding protein
MQSEGRWSRWCLVLVLCVLSQGWWVSRVPAADRARPFHIGALTASWGPTPMIVGFRDGLLELGYREDKDFVLGVRFTQGDLTALPKAARQLVQYGVDLIFTSEDVPTKAAQQATSQIPIVFASVSDPVGMGLVQSFARPGGNITGVTDLSFELGPKRVEVFHNLIPDLKRVLFPYDIHDAYSARAAQACRDAARRLGIMLVERPVRSAEEAQTVLGQVRKGEVDGLLHHPSPGLNIPGLILKATDQQGIPAVFAGAFWPEQGALASYGPDFHETGRQAARLVDKIFKGANPAELPVEVNSKIKFVINLKTAKALGLTIAPEMLFRADRLIR